MGSWTLMLSGYLLGSAMPVCSMSSRTHATPSLSIFAELGRFSLAGISHRTFAAAACSTLHILGKASSSATSTLPALPLERRFKSLLAQGQSNSFINIAPLGIQTHGVLMLSTLS